MTRSEWRRALLAEQFGPVTRQWRDTRPAAAKPAEDADERPLAPVYRLDDRRAS